MSRFWKRLKSPAGCVLAAMVLPVLALVGWLAWTHPGSLLALAGGVPFIGMALSADRETQYKEWPGIKSYKVKTGVTIYKGGFVCIDPSTGYAVPGADTANYRCVGVAEEQVAAGALASGTYSVRVRTGTFLMAATSIAITDVGKQMYVKDDQTFDDTSTNGIAAGILVEFVSSSSGWILCGPSAIPIQSITATAAELNKCDGINATAYQVVMEEVSFTETGAGAYTGTIAIPAGSQILDVAVHGIALWDAATSASLIVGDSDDDNGFFTATDLKATDLLAGEVNNFEHPGGKAGAYIASEQRKLYQATARNIIGVATSVGAGTAGRTRLVVTYANPTAVAATKV
jgi:hypothetical protein